MPDNYPQSDVASLIMNRNKEPTMGDFTVLCIYGCGQSFWRSERMTHNKKHHPMAVCIAKGHKKPKMPKRRSAMYPCSRCGTLFLSSKRK